MIETITKKELLCAIADLPDDALLVLGNDYGDRANTIQAIPLECDVQKAYSVESDYSNTGYKILGKQKAKLALGDDDIEEYCVYVLNPSSIEDETYDEDGDYDDE